jgi:hypothetical protein
MDILAVPATRPGQTDNRSAYDRLGRYAGVAAIVLMFAVSIDSGDGQQSDGNRGRLGCIARAGGSATGSPAGRHSR